MATIHFVSCGSVSHAAQRAEAHERESRLAAVHDAMEELRSDLDRAQDQKARLKRELARDSRRIQKLAKERNELREVLRIASIEDPETAQQAAMAMAARATFDRDRAQRDADVANTNLDQLRLAFSFMRDALEGALQKLDAPNCDECNGTGKFGAEEECDECGGIGLDWEAAS
ncbi:MAG: hypothetical protein NXI30_04390 [bacterium]|nr:hypothetical protein [bacterium]